MKHQNHRSLERAVRPEAGDHAGQGETLVQGALRWDGPHPRDPPAVGSVALAPNPSFLGRPAGEKG